MLYYAGYRISREYKSLTKKRLRHPVISVGNITLGGTGKTPAVIAIAQEALKRGYRPCVLTRGYKGKIRKPLFVSRGNGALHGPIEAGDEAVLMSERLKGVEVIKSANRYEGGLLSHNANLFIVDDGYQHWRLHRDKNILLIDAIDPFGNGKLLPLGRLREPLKEVRRADTIVITRSNGEDGLIEKLKTYNPNAGYFLSTMKPARLVKQSGESLPVDTLRGKRIYAFCGIGNPGGFIQTLVRFGITLVGFKSFEDHHVYTEKETDAIYQEAMRTSADSVITTEKDMIKMGDIFLPHPFAALRIEFEVSRLFYERIFAFQHNKGTPAERRAP
jgi:tetraacyldisaccharide 4'-kinase